MPAFSKCSLAKRASSAFSSAGALLPNHSRGFATAPYGTTTLTVDVSLYEAPEGGKGGWL